MKNRFLLLTLTACTTGLLLASTASAVPSYSVQDIGNFGGTFTYATDINYLGQIVGYSETADGLLHAFITGPNGQGMTDLGTLDGEQSGALGINDVGQVIGYVRGSNGVGRPFITGPNGSDMAYAGANATSIASINGSGQITGQTGANPWLAYIANSDGTNKQELNSLGGYISYGNAINDAGQITGRSYTVDGQNHGFVTGPDGIGTQDLGTLGGSNSEGVRLNASGQVVGWSDTANGTLRGFVTKLNGLGMQDLGSFNTQGRNSSRAFDINDKGQVVGFADTLNESHAFVTGDDGQLLDLNNLVTSLPEGIYLGEASAINNAGQIVAWGFGQVYLLTPIPEPNTMTLMLIGLIGLGLISRTKILSDRTKTVSTRPIQ